jgi:signal transduction histidine kinase/ActR/RegA family two-component response regulator
VTQTPDGRPFDHSIAVPLRTQNGEVIGTLTMGSHHVAFAAEDVTLLESVASQAAMAIHNAQLYEEAQQRAGELQRALADVRQQEQTIRYQAERLSLLNEFARTAGSTLDLKRIYTLIVGQVAALMGAQRCVILQFDAQADLFRYAAIWHKGRLLTPRANQTIANQGTASALVRETQRPYTENDTRASPIAEMRARGAEGILSLLAVPIVVSARVWGLINVGFGERGAATVEHRDFLIAIASHLAVAIQNAELFTSLQSAHEQLQATQQQAIRQERLRALGQMASGIAHDLNQYLGLIVGHAEIAQRALKERPVAATSLRGSLETLTTAALDGAAAVKRLLAFAQPQPEGPPERIAAAELVQEVVSLTAPRWRDASAADGGSIDVQANVVGAPELPGWPAELREALTNLIFNAADAMPHGGLITLSARQRDDRVEIEVADTGAGMPPDVQTHIFEPFFTTKGERGTGLGLPLVQRVVEQHQGTIAIESELGKGTTVRLSLPAGGETEHASTAAQEAQAAGQPLRVLAVDDQTALAELIRLMLSPSGHRVSIATTGEEALEQLAREGFDVVISDVGMGAGMDGWQLAEHVRARHPGVRVCLATGWGAQIDPVEARRKGIVGVIAKPYRIGELLGLVAACAAERPDGLN